MRAPNRSVARVVGLAEIGPSIFEQKLINVGLSNETARLYDRRRVFSDTRLEELERRLRSAKHLQAFENICVYAAGSYARGEASQYSDIDLFFIHDDRETPPVDEPKLKGIRVVSTVIREIEEEMELPAPSNDGEFLKIASVNDILCHLGGTEDDHTNNFTSRMLLLLESRAVYDPQVHRRIISKIIDSYFRDYEDHAAEFRPTFLVNDILRFWRTLCLNYEHKRNQTNSLKKNKQKIRNFKLGFSRLSTCFATVSLLSSYNNVEPEELNGVMLLTPVERLLMLSDRVPDIRDQLRAALEHYAWFLEKTAFSSEELEEYFSSKPNRVEAFGRAHEYGELIYRLIKTTSEERGTLRYLLV